MNSLSGESEIVRHIGIGWVKVKMRKRKEYHRESELVDREDVIERREE